MKKQIINYIIIYALIALCLGLWVFSFVRPKPLTAEQIYLNNLQSIVELKAFNDETIIAYGSAVCISKDGTFITNAHNLTYKELGIIKEFTNFQIRFADSENYINATLQKIDNAKDIALIKIDPNTHKLKSIKIRTAQAKEGEKVYAIGNGQNYGISIINGIVSQRELTVTVDERTITAIQCGLDITEGNSGGALLDANGELLGITTFRIKDQLNNVIYGTSFAIPVKTILEFINS
jgi:serine protease DegS